MYDFKLYFWNSFYSFDKWLSSTPYCSSHKLWEKAAERKFKCHPWGHIRLSSFCHALQLKQKLDKPRTGRLHPIQNYSSNRDESYPCPLQEHQETNRWMKSWWQEFAKSGQEYASRLTQWKPNDRRMSRPSPISGKRTVTTNNGGNLGRQNWNRKICAITPTTPHHSKKTTTSIWKWSRGKPADRRCEQDGKSENYRNRFISVERRGWENRSEPTGRRCRLRALFWWERQRR